MKDFKQHPFYAVHNLDSAFNSLFNFYKTHFPVLFILSAVMSCITQLLTPNINLAQYITEPEKLLETAMGYVGPAIAIIAVEIVFFVFITHYIIFCPLEEDHRLVNSTGKSLKYLFPFLIMAIILFFAGSIGVTIGAFALFIGAIFVLIYMAALYCLILPTLMVEGTSIANAFHRIFKILHKDFWKNYGWVTVTIIMVMIASMILSLLVSLPFSNTASEALTSSGLTEAVTFTKNPLYIILASLTNGIIVPIMPILGALLYFNGRAKEEPDSFMNLD